MKGRRKYSSPPSWPRTIQYIKSYRWHTSISPEIRQRLTDPENGHASSPQPLKVVIRSISNPSHPANGQYGLFAAQRMPAKTYIIDYIGEIHSEDRESSDYDLCLTRFPDGTSVGIDASRMGNEARFINDYRGVATHPNVVFQQRRGSTGEIRMSLWSGNEEIRKDTELVVSYGKSWWRHRVGAQAQE